MLELPKIKSLDKIILGEIGEERRIPIPSSTKRAVYARAKGKCESCGRPLKMSDKGAQFHHTRKPTVKSRASTIQFLCAYCHRKHGHEYYTVTKQVLLGSVKEKRIKRKRVRKHKSPHWEKKTESTRRGTRRSSSNRKKSQTTKARRKRRTKR